MKPVINSEKHIIQITPSTVIGPGAIGGANIATAVQEPDGTNPNHVAVGTIIKAVYVEMWMIGGAQNIASTVTTVEKVPGGNIAQSYQDSITLHTYSNKKNILYTTQGLMGEQDSNPIPFIRMWIKIPKGKQRFGLGDILKLNISAITNTVEFCGMFIFKSYN